MRRVGLDVPATHRREFDERGEEELLFLVEVAQGATEVEVDEVAGDVSPPSLVADLGQVLQPPRLSQRVVVVVGQLYPVSRAVVTCQLSALPRSFAAFLVRFECSREGAQESPNEFICSKIEALL